MFDVVFSYGKVTLCYEAKENSKEDIESLEKERKQLEESIERRKKLLSNERYVNNAPQMVVKQEREKLADEESKLKIVLDKLK